MAEDYSLGTVTLARLFAAQGHWEKAVRIYRQLLEREPERQDIAQALADAEQQLSTAGRRRSSDLGELFGQWIDLLLRYDRLCKLKRLKDRF
jgi:tetratricopeptide (TPR) repeat protein